MRIQPLDPKQKIDLGRILGKNLLRERLKRSMYEFVKSVIEASSNVKESKTYDKTINDPIYDNRWQKAINEKLWNLDSYQTWIYTFLPARQKAIGNK